MRRRISSRGIQMSVRLIPIVGLIIGLTTITGGASAQIKAAPDPTISKEVEAAQLTAKNAAEFEFLGTLARTCFLPPSRSEDFNDIPAPYVSDPSKAPPRSSW